MNIFKLKNNILNSLAYISYLDGILVERILQLHFPCLKIFTHPSKCTRKRKIYKKSEKMLKGPLHDQCIKINTLEYIKMF